MALATATLGLGLLAADFRADLELGSIAKFVAGGCAIAAYAMTIRSFRNILEKESVDGRDVAQGPLRYMFVVVTCVIFMLVIGIVEDLMNRPPPV